MSEAKRPRGFAAIDKDRAREISSMGGKAAHAAGTAHKFTSDSGREAGKKSWLPKRRKAVEVSDGH